MTIQCKSLDNVPSGLYRSIRDAWTYPAENRVNCTIEPLPPLWQTERDAMMTATYEEDSANLHLLYEMCAETEMGNAGTYGPLPYSEGQRAEAEGAFLLCPDHPDVAVVRGYMDAGATDDQMLADGKLIYVGTYKVGEGIQPGTYVAEWETATDGCYWEINDETGEIIDNNFVTSAFRVEFSVPSDAYSVTIEGCGGFRLVE